MVNVEEAPARDMRVGESNENDEEVEEVCSLNDGDEGLHSVAQIELSLENITYAPIVRSGAGAKSGSGGGGGSRGATPRSSPER